jgi:hypothetical protein
MTLNVCYLKSPSPFGPDYYALLLLLGLLLVLLIK